MATTKLTKTGLNKQDKGDLNWEQDLDDGFDDFESRIGKSYAGDPNGNVSAEWLLQTCYDTSNSVIYVATTTGAAGTAVWEAVLEVSQLAVNGGSIPETDRENQFVAGQRFFAPNNNDTPVIVLEDQNGNIISRLTLRNLDGSGGGNLELSDISGEGITINSVTPQGNGSLNISDVYYEGGTRVVESGSNSDGYWVRYSDGTQVAGSRLEVSYNAAENLQSTWSYPNSFSSVPYGISGSSDIDDLFNNTNVSTEAVGPVVTSSEGSTSTSIRVSRVPGGNDLQAGDQITVRVIAFGTWT
jgi:hypothetical protein